MYSVLKSYGLNGLNGFAGAVEADVSGGLPAFSLVGLPDSAVRESGDRVRSAVKNLGYKWPDRHITVNLAPADIRKSGPVYDLPLLLAVLAAFSSVISVAGDLTFSLIKRHYGIKDYGNIMPGHGGARDRFDSVIFVAPLFALMIQYLPVFGA